jgi:hypothetical protein
MAKMAMPRSARPFCYVRLLGEKHGSDLGQVLLTAAQWWLSFWSGKIGLWNHSILTLEAGGSGGGCGRMS